MRHHSGKRHSWLMGILVWSSLIAVWFFSFISIRAGAQPVPIPQQVASTDPSASPSPLDFLIPPSVKQGEVLKIQTSRPAASATLAGRKVAFFAQPDGTQLAMVPVSVFQKTGHYPLTIYDSQGAVLKSTPIQISNAHFRTQNITVSKSTGGLQPMPGEMEAVQALKVAMSPTRLWSEPFISPTPDCQNSPFGNLRYHNGKPTGDYHKGVDLRSPQGRPIKAIAGGKIQIARMFRLHGGTVGIDHGQGVSSIYIHMSKLAVKEGQVVQKGETVGYVGSTGFATGPHLHWGLYVNGLPVNPNQWVQHVSRCG